MIPDLPRHSPHRRARGWTVLPIALLLLAVGLLNADVARAEQTVTWQRYDVTIDLRDDGSFHITERQQILFEGGSFSGGFAILPLDRMDRISNISIYEEGSARRVRYREVAWDDFTEAPRTYTYREAGGELEINWGFPETEDDSRTFTLEYDVEGALRVYETATGTRQQIWWTAVSRDVTEIATVEEATVTINLPVAVDPATAMLGEDGDEAAVDHSNDGQVWSWSRFNMRPGDEFIVRLEVPKIVEARVPAWQAPGDAQRLAGEERSDRQALYDVIAIGLGLLGLAGGGALLYGLWYSRGRDPHVGLVAEFLPAPPDDLPPGAAGALIDEVAHERDMVATLVDLGRRGVLKIDEEAQGSGRDFSITRIAGEASLLPFEQSLIEALFSRNGSTDEVRLSAAKAGFARSAEAIKEKMYAELVKRGYFAESPEATRRRWKRTSRWLGIGAVAAGFLLVQGPVDFSGSFLFPIGVAGFLAMVLSRLSNALPEKTLKGAEATAKWNAFRRYLTDIEKYDKVAESKEIFDKYLPYAVAFGLEQGWVRKFAAAGAAPPAWYGPVATAPVGDWTERQPHRRAQTRGSGGWVIPGGGGGTTFGGGSLPDIDLPDLPNLQDVSKGAGRSLQGTSSGFFDLLSSAAGAFIDIAGSGGSSGARRSWGGGGGGFSGGGSRGGSSGGGRRGFH